MMMMMMMIYKKATWVNCDSLSINMIELFSKQEKRERERQRESAKKEIQSFCKCDFILKRDVKQKRKTKLIG